MGKYTNPYGVWELVRMSVSNNKPAEMRYHFRSPGYAVYGEVHTENGKFYWEARVMLSLRADPATPIRGYALTLESAKKIVETLCYETDTCDREPELVKNKLYYDLLWDLGRLNFTKDKFPLHRQLILEKFQTNGVKKLDEMINAGIVYEASNDMLSLSESGKKDFMDTLSKAKGFG